MVHCFVPGCGSEHGRTADISYHEFPSDDRQREKWLKVIARKDRQPNFNSNSSRVCSRHFKDSDYKLTGTKRRLLPDAVPSMFPEYPKYMQPRQVIPRTSQNIQKRAKFQELARSGQSSSQVRT